MENRQTVKVSIVIPAFNEAAGICRTIDVIGAAMDVSEYSYEIIVVDDGSTDSSPEIISNIAHESPNVVPVFLSRNFGKESAMAAGIDVSVGDCVIILDADLQHPPNLIKEMLEKWQEGYDVVNGRKIYRGNESLIYRLFAKAFNWGMSREVGRDFSGASDFKLIDRQVANAIKLCPERNRFFRGLVSWVGFRFAQVDFEVTERQSGDSKWDVSALLSYALSSFSSFSSMPLRIVAYLGFTITAAGIILLLQTIYNYATNNSADGFTTVIAVEILLGGLILLALGTISLYIAKIYDEQKARPLYIIRKTTMRDVNPTSRGKEKGEG